MRTRRVSNWPHLLNEFIESRRSAPFAWGVNDCCIFACDAVLEITGIDPANDIRGTYEDASGAARVLVSYGGVEGVAQARALEHGFQEVPVAMSQRGDVVIATMRGHATMGICIGAEAAFVAETGLIFWPLKQCSRAWRVE